MSSPDRTPPPPRRPPRDEGGHFDADDPEQAEELRRTRRVAIAWYVWPLVILLVVMALALLLG